ncbi:MAG: hypothetical protein GPOALKHO_000951 [Sodalis sp.]|uniref:hypothetical protein n=1 Tax=Sodalis sp. (in: enterobacteria) TaxID=1898979 RepID=UPI0038732A1D|nr:MAG: hypothetical protein GPOALKHO_000951 [Sodalis sp.]
MADTVYGNVSLGRETSEQQVWRARVGAAADASTLDTEGVFSGLSEQGNTLSVGHKQLLSLARALVSTPGGTDFDAAPYDKRYPSQAPRFPSPFVIVSANGMPIRLGMH